VVLQLGLVLVELMPMAVLEGQPVAAVAAVGWLLLDM
jgi:hypothetical protein